MQFVSSLLRPTLVLAFLIAALTAPNSCSAAKCTGSRHDLIVGSKFHEQKLLWKEHVKSNWKFMASINKKISFPKKKEDENKYIITQIRILDQYTNGNGGCPSIEKGGVGHSNVTILIEGKIFRGIEFDVRVYGLKRSKAKKFLKLR